MLVERLKRHAQIVTNLSIVGVCLYISVLIDLTRVIGVGPSKRWYLFFTSPITLSICIQVFAIFLVVSVSLLDNCFLPFVNAGMINSAEHLDAKSPCSGKLLSDEIWSPGQWNLLLIKPGFPTMYVSVAGPPHPFEMKLIAQEGYKKWDIWLYCLFCNSDHLVLGLSGLQVCQ